jgi:hypothetical protein
MRGPSDGLQPGPFLFWDICESLVWPQPERLGPVNEDGLDAKSENTQCVADIGDGISTRSRSFLGLYEAMSTNRRFPAPS